MINTQSFIDPEDVLLDKLHNVSENSNFSCFICVHQFDLWSRCKAFPEGIPQLILGAQIRHTKKYKGQKGDFVFERIK